MTKQQPSSWQWVARQLAAVFLLVLRFVFWGVVEAIARKNFRWRAFFVGWVGFCLSVVVLGYNVLAKVGALQDERQLWLWGGIAIAATIFGFLVGFVSRRIGFWESYLAVLLTAGLVTAHLQWDLSRLWARSKDSEAYFDFVLLGPGARLLGSQWYYVVVLMGVCSFLLFVFGGSLAALFFPDRRLDRSFSFELRIGLRHLLGHRRGLVSVTALVALIGVSLGVAALIAVNSVMAGYQNNIQARILTTNAHLMIQKYGVDFAEYLEIMDKTQKVEGVVAVTPFTFNEAMLSSGVQSYGVLIKGVVPAQAGAVTNIDNNLCEAVNDVGRCVPFSTAVQKDALGRALTPREGLPSLVVGLELFKKLKLPMGSLLSITTPVGIAGAKGNAPKRMTFYLGGIFRSGVHEFDSRLVYMELGASQDLLGMGSAVNGVEVKISEPEHVEHVEKSVLRAIGRYPYKTLNWRKLNEPIFMALKYQKIIMFLVLNFIVIVGAFNIASTLFMSVFEKGKEIGVLKAMGARDNSIMKIFVLEGWFVGGVGTLLGLLLGLLAAWVLASLDIEIAADVYMVESLKVTVQPIELLLVVVAAFVISHLATIYPALNAALQKPVDAMRD